MIRARDLAAGDTVLPAGYDPDVDRWSAVAAVDGDGHEIVVWDADGAEAARFDPDGLVHRR